MYQFVKYVFQIYLNFLNHAKINLKNLPEFFHEIDICENNFHTGEEQNNKIIKEQIQENSGLKHSISNIGKYS